MAFKDADPPIFKGELDPHVANVWIKEMEKVIEISECSEEQNVKFATHSLRKEAVFWWDTVRQTEDCSKMAWTRFKELFFDKYFPTCMKNEMEMKFLGLKQEGMSVSEYLSRFLELSRETQLSVNSGFKKDNKKIHIGKKESFRGSDKRITASECKKCGLKLGGDICYRADGLSYNYGEKGHIASQCPKPKVISCYSCGQPGH
ncbi:uncharacterized protein LOC141660168 [Apium graveolens]|uniref:uncharacterized protein LOC141660168 n=1 Tax=Apium graveolens TaxID=4045 RepID=UPI003D7A6257